MLCPEAFGFAFSLACSQRLNDAGVVCRGEGLTVSQPPLSPMSLLQTLTSPVRTGTSDCWVETQSTRGEWRSASTTSLAPYATTCGTLVKLGLCAGNLATPQMVCVTSEYGNCETSSLPLSAHRLHCSLWWILSSRSWKDLFGRRSL